PGVAMVSENCWPGVTVPPPGSEIVCEPGPPPGIVNGRASEPNTPESKSAAKVCRPRKKKPASTPFVRQSSSHAPTVNRPPEKAPLSRSWSPNSKVVPGLPRKPTSTAPVAGLTNVPVVKSGGTWSFLSHQSKYSARTQTRPSGPQGVQQLLQPPVVQPFG